MRINSLFRSFGFVMVVSCAVASCAKRPPVAQPPPPPVETAAAEPTAKPPAPVPTTAATAPTRVDDRAIKAVADDSVLSKSIEQWNENSPLKPAFFALDSSDLDDAARAVVTANAEVLKQYPTLMITLEGHADERGTAEYNLALGERRAMAVQTYLVSLGVPANRLKTVSYGKEFPFDAGHDESAWSKNRRAHFVITGK
jgi:peptidoglycan-associated lipoprotein